MSDFDRNEVMKRLRLIAGIGGKRKDHAVDTASEALKIVTAGMDDRELAALHVLLFAERQHSL